MSSITNAINAYSALAKAVSGESEAGSKPLSAEGVVGTGSDFAQVLKEATKTSIDTMRNAESETAAAVAGKADIREVVAAVTNAELTLQTVVNVRDKVINAYNDIIRMPV